MASLTPGRLQLGNWGGDYTSDYTPASCNAEWDGPRPLSVSRSSPTTAISQHRTTPSIQSRAVGPRPTAVGSPAVIPNRRRPDAAVMVWPSHTVTKGMTSFVMDPGAVRHTSDSVRSISSHLFSASTSLLSRSSICLFACCWTSRP